MSRDFFFYLSKQNAKQKYWCAIGSRQWIRRKGQFESKAKKSYNLALEAISYQLKGMNSSAKKRWRKIYGTAYPG